MHYSDATHFQQKWNVPYMYGYNDIARGVLGLTVQDHGVTVAHPSLHFAFVPAFPISRAVANAVFQAKASAQSAFRRTRERPRAGERETRRADRPVHG
jgi:hypothetical protein